MKKIFTLLAVLPIAIGMASQFSFAQTTGGPDAFGYIWRDSNDPNGPTYTWIDITTLPGATDVKQLADDNIRGPFPVGFDFRYYWYDVSTFRVGSNGYIGFTSTPVAHPFPTIPLAGGINNWIAMMTTDLTFVDNAGVDIPGTSCWYWISPGADTLIVSYINVPFWTNIAPGYTGTNTFQVILSAVDSSITVNYQDQQGASVSASSFVTVGIENISGNIGLQHSYNVYPPVNYSVKYYYPASTTFQVNDAACDWNDNPESAGKFMSRLGSPFTMTTEIRNAGNTTLNPFNVFSRVVNASNSIQASNNFLSDTLLPSQTQFITHANTYTPSGPAGTYRYITDTQLTTPPDNTPSNNQRVMELQVVDTTQTSILLTYDNGVDAGLGGLNWTGGSGGAAVHFVPPFYPCNVVSARAYIAGNANLYGFALQVFDDDGVNGTPLTMLDSQFVSGGNVVVGSFNSVTFPTPIQVDSGGIYVAWMMGGEGITLGQNQFGPFSYRTWEVLGSASLPSSWAQYRYTEIEDLMINITIEKLGVGVSENETPAINFTEVYPNPVIDFAFFNYTFENPVNEISYKVFDAQGKLVFQKNNIAALGTRGEIALDATLLGNGLYTCHITAADITVQRKFTVAR